MTLDDSNIKQKVRAKIKFNQILEQIATDNRKYDYSKSVYTGVDNLMTITCPEHGEFQQAPFQHFNLNRDCPKCGKITGGKARAKSNEEFIKQANIVHNSKYDYSKVKYQSNHIKVDIICPIHGLFSQAPADHLSGHSCKKCGSENTGGKLTLEQFVTKANQIHNNKYIYTNTIYTKSINKLIIECPYHGEFVQTASDHLNGNGCQTCGENRKRAKYFTEPTILYYVYFPAFKAYKIGITLESRGINKRFISETGLEYTVLKSTVYQTGKEAYLKEQQILKENSQHKYKGPKFFKKGGESECFNIDILGIINDEDIV